jgi:hypothetical protein
MDLPALMISVKTDSVFILPIIQNVRVELRVYWGTAISPKDVHSKPTLRVVMMVISAHLIPAPFLKAVPTAL